ncbi:MAG: hypothetical protein J5916_11870, partial [Oscillospiraceae bacterium]|nr:hypothetical protein [Oscillospiraceae bacterium]
YPTLWVMAVTPGNIAVGNLSLELVLPSGEVAAAVVTDETGIAAFDLAGTAAYADAVIRRSQSDSSDYGPAEPVSVVLDTGSLVSVGGQSETGFNRENSYVIPVYPDRYSIIPDPSMLNGSVTLSSSDAAVHDLVTVTVVPAENYVLDALQVMQGDTAVPFSMEGAAASFEMPRGDVTVSASFKEAPRPAFATHSLVLGGELGLNFFLDLPVFDGADYSDSYMDFTVNGKTVQDPFDPSDTDLGGSGCYGFTCSLNALQLADEITAVYHYRVGNTEQTVSEVFTAEGYLNALIGSDEITDEVKTLARALLDYGYHSQVFLSKLENRTVFADHTRMSTYFTESYSEEQIADILKALSDQEFLRGRNRNIRSVSCSLILDSVTSVYLYVTPAESYSGTVSALLDNASVPVTQEADGRYRIVIPAISADRLGNTHHIVIQTEGAEPMTVQLSALSYVKACLESEASSGEMVNAMAALYHYYKASDALKQAN